MLTVKFAVAAEVIDHCARLRLNRCVALVRARVCVYSLN